MSLKTRAVVVGVLGLLALTAGILVLVRTAPHSATVQDVLSDPEKYYGGVVRLTGTASGISPVAVKGFRIFHLTDGTGSIWVITRQSAPQSGARIGVQGRVNTGIKADLPVIGGLSLGTYFVEEKRRSGE